MKVLIVGAGPTGLTAAVELARHGVVADIVDSKSAASTLSRAVGVLPASLRTLAKSGVSDQILAEGIPIEQVELYQGDRPLARFPLLGGRDRHHHLVGLAQDRTEAILHDAFVSAGGAVRYETALNDLQQNAERVEVSLGQGGSEFYDYVIGADGTRSRTREVLGLQYSGYDLPDRWSIADVDADRLKSSQFTIWRLGAGRVAIAIALEQNRFRLVSNTDAVLSQIPADIGVANVRREGQFTISVRQVSEYGRGRVWLAGDAAHCHSPVGGRGMNLGIADAAVLADCLVNGRLNTYTASRHRVGARIIKDSERARRAMTSPNPLIGGFINTAFKAVGHFDFLQRRFARETLDVAL